MEIVKRSDDGKGSIVLPRYWVVERTLFRFGRNRRLAKDFENLAETLAPRVTLASIQVAARRLARAQVVSSTNRRLGMHDDRAPQTPRLPAAEAERPLSVQSGDLRQGARERARRAEIGQSVDSAERAMYAIIRLTA